MRTLELAHPMDRAVVESPVGALLIRASERGLAEIGFKGSRVPSGSGRRVAPFVRDAARQLDEYFRGKRRSFDMPLDFGAAPEFSKAVWRQIFAIPFGSTVAYGDIAAALGRPLASRAVGQATGSNPIAVVVPCHRVIGKDGSLTGFGGGMERKRWLLRHERLSLT